MDRAPSRCGAGSQGSPTPPRLFTALSSVALRAARAAFLPAAGRSPRSSPGCRWRCSAFFTSAPASFVSPLSAGFPSSSAPWGSDGSSGARSRSPLPSPCQGLFPRRQRAPAPPERSSPLSWDLCFYCPGSVSLCNPPGFVFGVGWVPQSRSPRAMGARRCGAAARGAWWMRSLAAGAPRWHFDVSGARRVPGCLSRSLELSPPLPRCAHTRTRTHARTHRGGGLSAIASRTEKLCSPLGAPGLQWPPLPCSGPVTRGPCPATAHWPQPRPASPPP